MDKIVEPFTTRVGKKINNSLDYEGNKQALKRKYEVLTSKASDIEIKVMTTEQVGKKRRTTEVGNWLGEVEKFKEEYDQLVNRLDEVGYFRTLQYRDHVKKLIEGAEELINQSDTFGELLLDMCETSKERLFVTQLHGEALKQELDNILACLKAESNQVQCIGIYGMGGVGKTTLARHIYTNLRGTLDEFYVYWVTVSQEADINKLQHDLAKELNFCLSKDDDFETKAAKLHRLLREKKKVVIIFDDVWKRFDLREIGIPLDVDGCKVIITSRLRDVCNQMHCKKIIKVQPLREEEARKLFFEKLDCANKLSLEVEKVAKKMANKCDGLPLAIITVARSMIGVDDIHEWRDALEELNQSIMGHDDMKDEVLPILLYSYNRLRDTRMQKCFLYCSMYPEDYAISRDELVELLISEGVLRQRDTRRAEFDQGHMILNNLINSCLLDSVGVKQSEVKMHDLLREMAIEITRESPRYMIKAGLHLHDIRDDEDWTKDLDKVSLMRNLIAEIPEGFSPRCPRLSTLIMSFNPLRLIPNSFFACMCGVRVLNLRGTSITKLPNSISKLENLTALLLGSCTSLFYVPSLSKLKALMELDLNHTRIEELPDGMECLVKLKCLNMKGMYDLLEIRNGLLLQFPCLQCLFLPYNIKVQVEEIESLKMLEEFEGWIDDVWNSNWFNKSPPLTSYRIVVGNSYGTDMPKENQCFIKLRKCSFRERRVDVQLELPPNIQCLVIEKFEDSSNYTLKVLPSSNYGALQELYMRDLANLIGLIKWEPRALMAPPPPDIFSSLSILWIVKCHKIKNLFSRNLLLHNFQNLEMINVNSCDQMEEIIVDDEQEDDDGVGSSSSHSSTNNSNHCPTNFISLPKLKTIHLCLLPKLESIYKGTINCCDSIEYIIIKNCEKLKRLPFFHPFVDENPPPSSPSSSSRYYNTGKVTSPFPNLRSLDLHNLPKLKSICDRIMICHSIEDITIKNCRQLSQLPLFLPRIDGQPSPPLSLQYIVIREEEIEWWDSLEWDHPNSNKVLRRFLK